MDNLISAIVFLIILLFFNFKLKRALSDPLVLHSITWLFVFIVGYFNYDVFYALNSFFWNSWILWFISFFIGYIFFLPKKVVGKIKRIEYNSLPNYSFFLNLVTLAFFILTIVQGLSAGYGSFLMNLRLSFIFKTNTILQPFFFLFTLLWPLMLYEGVVYKNKKNLISLVIFSLVYTLASGGKFGILMTFSTLLLIINHRKKINKKYIFISLSVITLLIVLMSVFREHGESTFIAYTYAPLVAYQTIEGSHSIIYGHESFRFFYSMFHTLGIIDVQPPEDFYEYIMTPIMVNVYTALRPFYSDFGYVGVLLGGLVYGLFFGYCYKGYLKGKLVQSSLYFGYAFAIVSIPFADLLFLNLSLVFRTLIIILLIFITVNRKIKIVFK